MDQNQITTLAVGLGGAIIAAVVSFLIYWLNKKRPNWIICSETINEKIIDVQAIKERKPVDAEIKFIVDETELESLSLLQIRLRNEGSEVIHNPHLIFSIQGPRFLLRATPIISPPKIDFELFLSKPKLIEGIWQIELSYNYHNPYKQFHDEITLNVLSDTAFIEVNVEGNGEGWAASYEDISQKQRKARNNQLLLGLLGICVGAGSNVLISNLLGDKLSSSFLSGVGVIAFLLAGTVIIVACMAIFEERRMRIIKRNQ